MAPQDGATHGADVVSSEGCDDSLSWADQAACRGLNPTQFYVETEFEAGPAKAVCEHCKVAEACLEYALNHREHHGVWGGLTGPERNRLKRRRRRHQRRLEAALAAEAAG